MKVLFGAFVGRHGKGCQECGEDDIYIYLESSHFLQVLSSMALSFEFSIGLRILLEIWRKKNKGPQISFLRIRTSTMKPFFDLHTVKR